MAAIMFLVRGLKLSVSRWTWGSSWEPAIFANSHYRLRMRLPELTNCLWKTGKTWASKVVRNGLARKTPSLESRETRGTRKSQIRTYPTQFNLTSALTLPTHPNFWANPNPAIARGCDRPAPSRRSGNARSNSSRYPRTESAESSRRTSDTAGRSARAPPCPCETPSPSRESPSPTSARSRSIHNCMVSRVALNNRCQSSSFNLCVSAIGDSLAACRISSEYALPMPLRNRGSVSARFSVRFSEVSAARNSSRLLAKMSMPPGSTRAQRLFSRKELQRGPPLAAGFGQHQRSVRKIEGREVLPPTQLCAQQDASAAGRRSSGGAPARDRSSKPKAMRLPTRRNSRTTCPSTLDRGALRCAAETGWQCGS